MHLTLSLLVLVALVDPTFGTPSTGWHTIHEDDGVLIEVHPTDSPYTMVRGTTRLPIAKRDIEAALLDIAGFSRWFPGLSAWSVVEKSDTSALVYGQHELPWPFKDRDYVVRYTWRTDASGVFLLESRAVIDEGPPQRDGVVRLLQARSTWKLEPKGPTETRVQYTYNGDLGGSFPDLLRTMLWKREVPKVFAALREEAEKRSAEQ